MFFRAYIDESEDQETLTYGVGGFVGKASAWDALQPDWIAALPSGISHFHATDCFCGAGEFSNMRTLQRQRLLDRLTDLIAKAEIRLVAGTVDVRIYQKLAPKRKENDFGGNKYSAALEFAIKLSCESMDSSPFPRDIPEQCAIVMEENEYSPSAVRKIAQLRQNPHLWWGKRIGVHSQGTKVGTAAIPLLQVADLGVFLAVKSVAKAPQGRIPWWPYLAKITTAGRVFGIEMCDKASLELMFGVYGSLGKNVWDQLENPRGESPDRDEPEN